MEAKEVEGTNEGPVSVVCEQFLRDAGRSVVVLRAGGCIEMYEKAKMGLSLVKEYRVEDGALRLVSVPSCDTRLWYLGVVFSSGEVKVYKPSLQEAQLCRVGAVKLPAAPEEQYDPFVMGSPGQHRKLLVFPFHHYITFITLREAPESPGVVRMLPTTRRVSKGCEVVSACPHPSRDYEGKLCIGVLLRSPLVDGDPYPLTHLHVMSLRGSVLEEAAWSVRNLSPGTTVMHPLTTASDPSQWPIEGVEDALLLVCPSKIEVYSSRGLECVMDVDSDIGTPTAVRKVPGDKLCFAICTNTACALLVRCGDHLTADRKPRRYLTLSTEAVFRNTGLVGAAMGAEMLDGLMVIWGKACGLATVTDTGKGCSVLPGTLRCIDGLAVNSDLYTVGENGRVHRARKAYQLLPSLSTHASIPAFSDLFCAHPYLVLAYEAGATFLHTSKLTFIPHETLEEAVVLTATHGYRQKMPCIVVVHTRGIYYYRPESLELMESIDISIQKADASTAALAYITSTEVHYVDMAERNSWSNPMGLEASAVAVGDSAVWVCTWDGEDVRKVLQNNSEAKALPSTARSITVSGDHAYLVCVSGAVCIVRTDMSHMTILQLEAIPRPIIRTLPSQDVWCGQYILTTTCDTTRCLPLTPAPLTMTHTPNGVFWILQTPQGHQLWTGQIEELKWRVTEVPEIRNSRRIGHIFGKYLVSVCQNDGGDMTLTMLHDSLCHPSQSLTVRDFSNAVPLTLTTAEDQLYLTVARKGTAYMLVWKVEDGGSGLLLPLVKVLPKKVVNLGGAGAGGVVLHSKYGVFVSTNLKGHGVMDADGVESATSGPCVALASPKQDVLMCAVALSGVDVLVKTQKAYTLVSHCMPCDLTCGVQCGTQLLVATHHEAHLLSFYDSPPAPEALTLPRYADPFDDTAKKSEPSSHASIILSIDLSSKPVKLLNFEGGAAIMGSEGVKVIEFKA